MKIKKNGKVVNLTEGDLQRIVKRVLNEQSIDYNYIENLGNPNEMYKIIKKSIGAFTDDEAVVEAAFMAFDKNPNLYDEVNEIYLNDDYIALPRWDKSSTLLKLVAQNIDINKIWHKKSIASIVDKNGFI